MSNTPSMLLPVPSSQTPKLPSSIALWPNLEVLADAQSRHFKTLVDGLVANVRNPDSASSE